MGILTTVVAGFAGGIFIRSLFNFGWEPVVFMLLLATILFTVPRLLSVYSLAPLEIRFLTGLGAIFCAFVALGMIRAALADVPPPDAFLRDLRHRVSYEGIVVADPDVRDANQRIEIRVTSGGNSTIMLAVAPRHPSVAVGDRVFVSGTLALPEPFADDNGRIFRYDKYLQRNGVRFLLNFAYLRVIEEASPYSVSAFLARVKHTFTDGMNAALPEPYASLASGVVIGGKSGLGSELKGAFTRSGLIHIVVLSGHNVMIVASWVIAFSLFIFARAESILKRRVPRSASIVAGALALVLFVGIAGFSATAIRAMLMALIALYARATGRTYAAGRALFVVILLMLLWNPLYLAFDPGFGLSVAATAGLIWLAPIIEQWLDGKARRGSFLRVMPSAVRHTSEVWRAERSQKISPSSDFWFGVVAITLSAQIAVLPLLLYQTGNLSLVAIPANIIAALVVPFSMAFSYLAGFGGIFFGSLAPFFAIVIGIPAYLVVAVLIWITETSAALPFAAFTLPPFPFWLVLVAYAALIWVVALKRFLTKNASM